MRGRFDLRPAWQIRDLLGRHGYDLLHAHTPRTAMIAAVASRLSGVRWIYHVHSPAGRDSPRGWSNRFNASIERLALFNCGHLITVSESLRDDCLRVGFDPARMTVVHNGVPAIRPARRSEPVPGGRWMLGMVALMRPRKGLEVALEAVAKLRALGHDVTLRCIGPFESDAYASEISDRIERLRLNDRVQRVGFIDDIPSELARLDALVLPSLHGEGLPMVVLESMAAGLPVIATRVEGTPEAIRDGVDGLLAEPGDPVRLGKRIEDLVKGRFDWGVMAESASRRHADRFSDHSMARGTAEVYRRVCRAAGLC